MPPIRRFALVPHRRSSSGPYAAKWTRPWCGMTPEVAAAETALEVLENLPGLRSLPSEVRAVVVDAFEPVSYGFASLIVCEDEEADAFYVIVSGTARVVKRSEEGEEVSLHV